MGYSIDTYLWGPDRNRLWVPVESTLEKVLAKVKFEKSAAILNGEVDKYIPQKIRDIIFNFDWEVLDSYVDDNKGYVRIKITTYNFGKMLLNSRNELFFNLFNLDKSKGVSEAMLDVLVESFMKKWAACHVRNFEEKVIVSFTFDDGEWLIDSLSDDEVDKLVGGFYSFAKAIDLDNVINYNMVRYD